MYMSSANKGHSGLVAARALFGRSFRAVAISHRLSDQRISGAIEGARLALDALGYDAHVDSSDAESYDEYVGEGYGVPSQASLQAIRLAAESEGLLLDPIYTGKAFAGLIDHARLGRLGKSDTVVFIHTGGQPALFAWKDEIIEFLTGSAPPGRTT
jgi:1-aminocyclopropane-1-carboxylate deaminase/D-cysteine desulfhydrase-like pyridoxal-dependent ACC family enzyme